jgi:outer membrane immunogenic protein
MCLLGIEASEGGNMIRTFLISTVSALALTTTAFAADLPNTKEPAPFLPPPPPMFSWTGFYIGANAGLSAGNFNETGGYYDPYAYNYEWNSARSSGFSGGGQIGFNYQFANNIVIGVEADFQGSTLKGTYENYDYEGYYGYKSASKVDWWGTARGRVGYAFGNILPYVTGGFAYGHTKTSGYYYDDGYTSSAQLSGTHVGWTVGAGLEYALTHNLTVKIEYLYTDLGTKTVNGVYVMDDNGYDPSYYTKVKTQFSTVRAGLNWKFDWLAPPVPVVAKY